MAAHALWAMQRISHIPAIYYKSPAKDPTKTWACHHGLHRRHCDCDGNYRRSHRKNKKNKRSVRVSQRGRLQNASREMRTETKYLGRVVSAEGIRPNLEDVTKIQEWMSPRNKEELQSFLGFAKYYRDFVPFHAVKVRTMQELLKKNQHFHWEEKHQEVFDSVKQALADATAIEVPNDEGRLVLDTDASAVAIAGILHQEHEYNRKTSCDPSSMVVNLRRRPS